MQQALKEAEAAHTELSKRQTVLEEEYALALEAVQAAPFDAEPGIDDATIPVHGMSTPKGQADPPADGVSAASREGLPTTPTAAEPGAKRARSWKEESLHLLDNFASQLHATQIEGRTGVIFPDNDIMDVDGAGKSASSTPGEAPYGLLGPSGPADSASPEDQEL